MKLFSPNLSLFPSPFLVFFLVCVCLFNRKQQWVEWVERRREEPNKLKANMCSLLEAGAADFDGMLVSFKSSDLTPGAVSKEGDKNEVKVRVEEVQVDDDDGEEDKGTEEQRQQEDHFRDDSPKSLQDDTEDSSSATLAATETTGHRHPPTSSTPPGDAQTFHGFGALPAELRIKIWSLSFCPRVVELRPTRPNSPNWAPARTDDRRPQVSCFSSSSSHHTYQQGI